MIIAIHQPDYLPWLGLYYKIAHCDKFVYLDDAQYSNEAAHNYNVIKTPQGELRIKVPVKHEFGDPICTVTTRDTINWREKHLRTFEMNYAKAPFFKDIFPRFSELYAASYPSIAEFNIAMNDYICEGFGIRTPYVRSSELHIETAREERVIDICVAMNGDEYLSGNGARVYQVPEHFESRGVKLTYLDYKPIEYKQLWNKVGFLPCMSVIDYLFNCGFDWEYVEKAVKEKNAAEE